MVAGSKTTLSAMKPSAMEPSKLPRTWTDLVVWEETMKLMVSGVLRVTERLPVSVPSGKITEYCWEV